jgi:hypothetical protein
VAVIADEGQFLVAAEAARQRWHAPMLLPSSSLQVIEFGERRSDRPVRSLAVVVDRARNGPCT